jgi:hypothetical protein
VDKFFTGFFAPEIPAVTFEALLEGARKEEADEKRIKNISTPLAK